MRVNRIVRDDLDLELLVDETHVRDESLAQIPQLARPAFVADPGELAVHPETEAKRMSLRVILFADVWKVDVADLVQLVEGDEQRAITDRNVTGLKNK